jgi:hypothetical protein
MRTSPVTTSGVIRQVIKMNWHNAGQTFDRVVAGATLVPTARRTDMHAKFEQRTAALISRQA